MKLILQPTGLIVRYDFRWNWWHTVKQGSCQWKLHSSLYCEIRTSWTPLIFTGNEFNVFSVKNCQHWGLEQWGGDDLTGKIWRQKL